MYLCRTSLGLLQRERCQCSIYLCGGGGVSGSHVAANWGGCILFLIGLPSAPLSLLQYDPSKGPPPLQKVQKIINSSYDEA